MLPVTSSPVEYLRKKLIIIIINYVDMSLSVKRKQEGVGVVYPVPLTFFR